MDFTRGIMQEILDRQPARRTYTTFVETGTMEGDNVLKMLGVFQKVYTVELSEELYLGCLRRHAASGVRFLHGSSPVVIEALSAAFSRQGVVWYLDAHACLRGNTDAWGQAIAMDSPFPLFDELAVIRKRTTADIVIVDDVHAFGRNPRIAPRIAVECWRELTPQAIVERLDPSRVADSFTIGDQFVVFRKETQ